MACLRQAAAREGAGESATDLITASLRTGSARAYSAAWAAWTAWCYRRGHNPVEPHVGNLLNYLSHLFNNRRLAYSTIALHRSAISTCLSPANSSPLGAHPLVTRMLKGVFLSRPPPSRTILPTWDVAEVLDVVAQWTPLHHLSLMDLSRKAITLLALYSYRRTSDLSLLDIGPQYMARGPNKLVLQPRFGAKQDRPGHSSTPITITKAQDTDTCTLSTLLHYLDRTQVVRDTSVTALFISSKPPNRKATPYTLKRWLLDTLHRAGTDASPGSTRAAAARYAAATHIPMSTIMARGDWARARTVHRHYIRALPPGALQHLAHDQHHNSTNPDHRT